METFHPPKATQDNNKDNGLLEKEAFQINGFLIN